MNKIKKFKKSKKTNNKRNHKRRRMTRKLRGGVIKPDWPLDKETPPQPLNGTSQPIVVSDKPMVVQPVVVSEKPEPSDKNLQSLEDRIRLLEENATINLTHLDRETQRLEERINEIPQTDNTGELREQITALQQRINETNDTSPLQTLVKNQVLIGFEHLYKVDTNGRPLFHLSKPIFAKLNSNSDELRHSISSAIRINPLQRFPGILYLDIINELPVVKNNEFTKLRASRLLRYFSLYDSENNLIFNKFANHQYPYIEKEIDVTSTELYPKIFTDEEIIEFSDGMLS